MGRLLSFRVNLLDPQSISEQKFTSSLKTEAMSIALPRSFAGLLLTSLFLSVSAYSQNGNYVRNTENGAAPGQDNTVIGFEAGAVLDDNSTQNVFLGRKTGKGPATARQNVILGYNAFSGSFASVAGNVAIGNSIGTYLSSPSGEVYGNVVIGAAAGLTLKGNYSTYIGMAAGSNGGSSAVTDNFNSFFGAFAGSSNQNAQNTFLGSYAGSQNIEGSANVMIGFNSGRYSTNSFGSSASQSVFVGNESGRNAGGQNCTFVGYKAGTATGGYSTGNLNVAVGYQSSPSLVYGMNNTTLGSNSGFSNRDGSDNVFLGAYSGYSNTTGGANTYIGSSAGGIGRNSEKLQNATAIGFRAFVGVSYGLVLGDTTGTNVGIGTAYPNQRLTIRGNMNFLTASNLRFDNSPFLDINQNRLALGGEKGEFPVEITSSLRYKVASENQWADYVFAPAFRKLPIMEVAAFIQQNGHLPGIPSAKEVVENGVDAAQMDTKLLSQIEQLTLYAIEQQRDIEELKKENQQLRLEKESQRKDIQALKNQVNSILIHANR